MLYTGMQIFVFMLKCRDIEPFFWLNSDHIVVVQFFAAISYTTTTTIYAFICWLDYVINVKNYKKM